MSVAFADDGDETVDDRLLFLLDAQLLSDALLSMLPLMVVFVKTAVDAGSRPSLGMGGTEAGACSVESADELRLIARRRVTAARWYIAAAGEVELVVRRLASRRPESNRLLTGSNWA